jgi:hypothetical protein
MRKEPIYVIQKPKTDSNGDFLTPPTEGAVINGCVIWPRASEEKDGGDVGVDGDNIACPDNATARSIGNEDWVSYRGETFQVDEPPSRYVGKKVMLKTRKVTT